MTAEDLQIAGLVPLSTVDWPGHLAATVFCQGCPWRCTFCHNQAILPTIPAGRDFPGRVPWEQLEALLERRGGLLDAVVLSGGEATAQHAVIPAVRRIRALGFAVGLHTGGAYPARLAALLGRGGSMHDGAVPDGAALGRPTPDRAPSDRPLPDRARSDRPLPDDSGPSAPLVDWVALDVKAPPELYEHTVGRAGAWARVRASLALLLASGVDHELRTTLTPGLADRAGDVVCEVARAGGRALVLQRARPDGAPEAFRHALAAERDWPGRFAQAAAQAKAVGARCGVTVTVREG